MYISSVFQLMARVIRTHASMVDYATRVGAHHHHSSVIVPLVTWETLVICQVREFDDNISFVHVFLVVIVMVLVDMVSRLVSVCNLQ